MQGFSVTDLCAWYGEKQVLSNINMQIPGQGVTAIIGPSGCGKSTFIRCLNRMHELVTGARMAGEIRLGEQRVDGDETDPVLLCRQVGMSQETEPIPDDVDPAKRPRRTHPDWSARPWSISASSKRRSLAPRCGMRSKINSARRGRGCRAGSSSGCVSLAASQWSRTCCCLWMSPVRRLIRSQQRALKS